MCMTAVRTRSYIEQPRRAIYQSPLIGWKYLSLSHKSCTLGRHLTYSRTVFLTARVNGRILYVVNSRLFLIGSRYENDRAGKAANTTPFLCPRPCPCLQTWGSFFCDEWMSGADFVTYSGVARRRLGVVCEINGIPESSVGKLMLNGTGN